MSAETHASVSRCEAIALKIDLACY